MLIVGAGRSGTHWWMTVCRNLGLRAWHETYYSLRKHGPLPANVVEASWLAVPYFPSEPLFHVLRNPLEVISSLLHRGTFGGGIYGEWAAKHALEIDEYDEPVDRAARYWMSWNRMILGQAPIARARLEDSRRSDALYTALSGAGFDVDADAVAGAVATTPAVDVTKLNKPEVRVDDLDPRLRSEFVEEAAMWGYAVS